jgi:hypothetical protein
MSDILISFIILVVIGTIIVHISASFAGVKRATLKKAFFVALIGSLIFSVIPGLFVFNMVLVLIVTMVLIRLIYATTWPKAFVATIVYIT